MKTVTLENMGRDVKDLGRVEHDGHNYHVVLGSSDERGESQSDLDKHNPIKPGKERHFWATEMAVPVMVFNELKKRKAVTAMLELGQIRVR